MSRYDEKISTSRHKIMGPTSQKWVFWWKKRKVVIARSNPNLVQSHHFPQRHSVAKRVDTYVQKIGKEKNNYKTINSKYYYTTTARPASPSPWC